MSVRSELRLRPMTAADIPLGMRLKDIAGWNQTPEDWKNFLALGPGGCCVAEWGGVPVGTVTTVDYGGVVGWIGMVLVDPAYRRRGIGTFLIEEAVRILETRCPTVKLDATAAGREVYLPLGFKDELIVERRVRAADVTLVPSLAGGLDVLPVTSSQLAEIAAVDRIAFGADRGSLLELWMNAAPEYAFVCESAGRVSGFCLGRHGSRYEHLGPLVALDRESAQALLGRALEQRAGNAVVIDALTTDAAWAGMLDRWGFRLERRLTRMARGLEPPASEVGWQWAAAGPEVG